MKKTIVIENEELGVDWQDAGPWRAFELSTEGDCLSQLLENAFVAAIDQDGGEMYMDGLYDCSNEIVDAAEKLIARVFLASLGYKTTFEKKEELSAKGACL